MEFGSDFNLIDYPKGNGLPFRIPYNLYASGRQALQHLIQTHKFDTIWLPSYYCGESIEFLETGKNIVNRYSCIPTDNPTEIISNLPLQKNDLLVRFNYFGLFGFQDNTYIPCHVIEDHSHSITCEWANSSNADWCFASLRKTLPIAEGGILWSPRRHQLPQQPSLHPETVMVIKDRYSAMTLKSQYLVNLIEDKSVYLNIFKKTEEALGNLPISDISQQTREILCNLDIVEWDIRKRRNLKYLFDNIQFQKSTPILLNNQLGGNQFSLIVLFDSKNDREEARHYLISKGVYPSVLWGDVATSDMRAVDYSKHILSIHCDGRYGIPEMGVLCNILNKVL